MNDYYDINDPSIRTPDGRLNYNKLDYRPLMIHEVPQAAPLHNDNGTANLDRLRELIGRFSDGRHPEMVASLQRQLDAETARINTGYQNARNDFAQVGANLPQTYDLAGDYKHAQAMNAINYDKIRRNQASAPRQAGYYSSTLPQLPEYDTMNRDAMAYQEKQRQIAAERARQEAAERAYLEEQARKDAERKAKGVKGKTYYDNDLNDPENAAMFGYPEITQSPEEKTTTGYGGGGFRVVKDAEAAGNNSTIVPTKSELNSSNESVDWRKPLWGQFGTMFSGINRKSAERQRARGKKSMNIDWRRPLYEQFKNK